MRQLPLIQPFIKMLMDQCGRIQPHDLFEQRLRISQRDPTNRGTHFDLAGCVHGKTGKAHRHQQQRAWSVTRQLTTQRNRLIQPLRILSQLL